MKTKRELYKIKVIKPHNNILVHTTGSPSSMGALYLFVNATKKWNINIFVKDDSLVNESVGIKKFTNQNIDFQIYTDFLQEKVNTILKNLSQGRIIQKWAKSERELRPFLAFSGKELAIYAILKNLHFILGENKELNTIFKRLPVSLSLNFIRAYEKLQQEF